MLFMKGNVVYFSDGKNRNVFLNCPFKGVIFNKFDKDLKIRNVKRVLYV